MARLMDLNLSEINIILPEYEERPYQSAFP
jgi:hypothetical protein